MIVLLFVCWLLILFLEGALIASLILHEKQAKTLLVALSLPLSALVNVLIVFLFTIASIPLLWWTLLVAHAIVITAALIAIRFSKRGQIVMNVPQNSEANATLPTILLRGICIVLLAGNLFFSFSHIVILPTYDIDSLTNWTMRSEVSFYDHAVAFDQTEARGVAKPQYPFLFHALQITANQGQALWNDRAANTILFLTILLACGSIFLLLRLLRGTTIALLGLTLMLSVPLLAFHLSVAYADILLTLFAPLSFLSFILSKEKLERRWLVLSGLFAAAAAWTKLEGFVIVLLPWFILALNEWRFPEKRPGIWKTGLLTFVLTLPFPILLLVKELSLTPHTSDTAIGWHGDAFASALTGLFASGSMGVTWYVLPIAIVLILLQRTRAERLQALGFLLWGLFAFLTVLAAYVLTPNAVFLENGESYFRQLMPPAALLILWSVLFWKETRDLVTIGKEEITVA